MKKNALGKIHLYTGDGKGKTTAGLGLAMRALGRGLRVNIVFFDKGGTNYGERKILEILKESLGIIDFFSFGLDRIDAKGRFRFGVLPEDCCEGNKALKKVEEIFNEKKCDLLILDEINSSISLGMVQLEEFLFLLLKKPDEMELVLTGRNAPQALFDRAHLVTEMNLKKHYFYEGVSSRAGIEY